MLPTLPPTNLVVKEFGTARGQTEDVLAVGPFDLLVGDQTAIGAAVAAQKFGIPAPMAAVTPLSVTGRDLPPLGALRVPATGPAGRLLEAALRGLGSLIHSLVPDLGPVALGRLLGRTFLASIEDGIPIVVAGGSLDKPEVARRVVWSGRGIDRRTGSPKPARIAWAVAVVAGRPSDRARARELGTAALAAAGGAVAAADLLEALLAR